MAVMFFRINLFQRLKMLRYLAVAGLLLVVVVTVMSDECNLPPSQWCTSEDIARKCGVYKQCKLAMRIDPFAGPVNMTLYYESECPDCKRFFSTQLYHTWKVLGTQVLNLTLVPYGNAREEKVKDKWEFDCQHGEEECRGNVIQTCAINILGNINTYLPFIYCMESRNVLPDKSAKECAANMSIDIGPIIDCANGDKGNMLEHEMALKTDALNPPHEYVPWVTINGVHTERMERMAETDLLSLICETYKGDPPTICKHLQKCGSRQCVNNSDVLTFVKNL